MIQQQVHEMGMAIVGGDKDWGFTGIVSIIYRCAILKQNFDEFSVSFLSGKMDRRVSPVFGSNVDVGMIFDLNPAI